MKAAFGNESQKPESTELRTVTRRKGSDDFAAQEESWPRRRVSLRPQPPQLPTDRPEDAPVPQGPRHPPPGVWLIAVLFTHRPLALYKVLVLTVTSPYLPYLGPFF